MSNSALIIGAGPAGLMAAERLLAQGAQVQIFDAKPSIGRKFLMAGKSGLNLTKNEPLAIFQNQYYGASAQLAPMLNDFGPADVMRWANALGADVFSGSSGRVFPKAMKASPLLRAWLVRLQDAGAELRVKSRWKTLSKEGCFGFETPSGPAQITPDVAVLALGGGSWKKLGSDGQWVDILAQHGVLSAPFKPSNAALQVAWSPYMQKLYGQPIKSVALTAGRYKSRGEVILSKRGLEGSGIYTLSPALRERQELFIDLAPDLTIAHIAAALQRPKGKNSLSNFLRKILRLPPVKIALLQELARPLPADPAALARAIKTLPLAYTGLAPLDEAISTAGGVRWQDLNADLMLNRLPGVFCAGEMLDWEAPTGGYLINACLATGAWAGDHAANYAAQNLNKPV